jgi:hypothetical protein
VLAVATSSFISPHAGCSSPPSYPANFTLLIVKTPALLSHHSSQLFPLHVDEMDDGAYSFHDPDDDRGGRHAQYQQHSLLQPRFLQPTRPVQPRDRYRASRHEPQYDRVEDDEYEDEVPLDSFSTILHVSDDE